jgi:hypothetical protein
MRSNVFICKASNQPSLWHKEFCKRVREKGARASSPHLQAAWISADGPLWFERPVALPGSLPRDTITRSS